jgi:hypothetical protein
VLHVAEIAAVLVAYCALLLKERLEKSLVESTPRRRRLATVAYWCGVIVVGVVPAISQGFQWYRERRTGLLSEAILTQTETRARFNAALDSKQVATIEDSLSTMQADSIELAKLQDSEERAHRYYLYALNDLAFAYERVAYGDSNAACIYNDADGGIRACSLQIGPQMNSTATALGRRFLQCTEIKRTKYWDSARTQYVRMFSLIKEHKDQTRTRIYADEVIRAVRNITYFYLCDRLLLGERHDDELDDALELLEALTKDIPDRQKDANFKQSIFHMMKAQDVGALICKKPCSAEIAAIVHPGGSSQCSKTDPIAVLPLSADRSRTAAPNSLPISPQPGATSRNHKKRRHQP